MKRLQRRQKRRNQLLTSTFHPSSVGSLSTSPAFLPGTFLSPSSPVFPLPSPACADIPAWAAAPDQGTPCSSQPLQAGNSSKSLECEDEDEKRNSTALKIGLWNVESPGPTAAHVCDCVVEKDLDVLLLTETCGQKEKMKCLWLKGHVGFSLISLSY